MALKKDFRFNSGTGKAEVWNSSTSSWLALLDENTGAGFNGDMENARITNLADPIAAQDGATKAYVDSSIVGLYEHKGAYDANTNTPDLDSTPSGILKGDAYTVSVAGAFFTEAIEVGDVLIADQDNPTLLAHWTRVNKNIDAATTTTKGIVELATDGEAVANVVVQGNDSRLAAAATAMQDLVDDTTPQLGGDLDADGNAIKNIETGTVPQGTSNGTGVTVNAQSGKITMYDTVAAVTSEAFVLTNSSIAATSIVLLTVQASTAADVAPSVALISVSAGECEICITNHDGVNATTAAPVIHFFVINPA